MSLWVTSVVLLPWVDVTVELGRADLTVAEVLDADGSGIGLLVADWYTRESKRGGAWMNNLVDQSHLLDLRPVDAVRRLVEFTWDYYLAHPEFLTLLNSANLHRARHLEESKRAREMNSPLIEMLAEILERGRKDGSFRGGVDPLQLYVSIAGLSYFYLSNSHTLSAIFGRDLLSAKAKNERLTHMCDVILGYLLRS